jgi:NAD(P)-dependent dehydrogenase (short-subunit alcohol dehydrogenase family)
MAPTLNMNGKTCIVTGANSGIGKETTLALAQMGAHVVMICRSRQKGEMARDEIQRAAGSAKVDLLVADMSSLVSVRAVAAEILKLYPRIDVLINNAGGAIPRRVLSEDGIEKTVAGNHLGGFLLTLLLLDRLKMSAPSRVINVSSEAQRNTRLDLNDIQFEHRKYGGLSAYGQSKLLMNACTFELARRLKGTGVTVNCLHPGVVRTNIWPRNPGIIFGIILAAMKPFMLDAKKGAEVTIYLATSPEVENVTGEYFVKCKPASSNPLSRDPKVAADIWQWSQKMVGTSIA